MNDDGNDREGEISENLSDSHDPIGRAITYLMRGLRKMGKDDTCNRMVRRLDKMDLKLKEMLIDIGEEIE